MLHTIILKSNLITLGLSSVESGLKLHRAFYAYGADENGN